MSDYVVKDIALADFGRKELDIVETEMPDSVDMQWRLKLYWKN